VASILITSLALTQALFASNCELVHSSAMSVLTDTVDAAVKQHGSVRKAARALGINDTVLQLLRTGVRKGASAATLKKLGLRRKDQYESVRPLRETPGL
jgi:hypothetical protein